jgi:uncharacterized protein
MSHRIINLGMGIGLRPPHIADILHKWPPIDWFEIISENFMEGGLPLHFLDQLLERYPIVMHGVSLAIGSAAPLDWDYLKRLKALAKKTKTPWLSDHLCWGKLPGAHFHDLLPLPRTHEILNFVAERAHIIQDFLEVPFALENIASHLHFNNDQMQEWEFYRSIVEKANIFMMLDLNNLYITSRNEGFDPNDYLAHLPLERVVQIHLAGHADYDSYIVDTHDCPPSPSVLDIYRKVYLQTEGVSTLLEWDDQFLSLEETWKVAMKAKEFQKECTNA